MILWKNINLLKFNILLLNINTSNSINCIIENYFLMSFSLTQHTLCCIVTSIFYRRKVEWTTTYTFNHWISWISIKHKKILVHISFGNIVGSNSILFTRHIKSWPWVFRNNNDSKLLGTVDHILSSHLERPILRKITVFCEKTTSSFGFSKP